MKKLLFSLVFMLFAGLSFGQIKVINNGNTGIGSAYTTGGQNPAVELEVAGQFRVTNAAGTNNYSDFRNTATNLFLTKTSISGSALIDISPEPLNGTSNSKFRFFRTTNTSGRVAFDVHYGNNTAAVNTSFSGNEDSFIAKTFGNVAIGIGSGGGDKLHVAGDVFATGTITPSDKRLKNSVNEFNSGLETIMQLNPISYKYNGKAGLNTDREHIGVMAQELQEAAPYLVEPFTHYVLDEEDNVIGKEEYLKIRDSEIKYIIINAVQELKAENDALKAENEANNERITELENTMKQLLAQNNNTTTTVVEIADAELAQNTPNPFNERTTINYSVPTKSQNAFVQIFDMSGKIIKTVNVANGEGQLVIEAGELAAGTYSYNLVIDGKVQDVKKMVLTK